MIDRVGTQENADPANRLLQTPEVEDLSIRGRFRSYNSPLLQLMLPALTARYGWVSLAKINPHNVILGEQDPKDVNPRFQEWKDPGFWPSVRKNAATLATGATLLGLLGYYSLGTYRDLRTVYAEAVGYELNKKPEDVTFSDLFLKSRNAALEVTRRAFSKRTATRTLAVGSFFYPWHRHRAFPHVAPDYSANVEAGVGILGAYLALDGFFRKLSFFDAEQDLANLTMDHGDKLAFVAIAPENIQSLLTLQRRHRDRHYASPLADSAGGQQEFRLASRIAELMNQTYHNAPKEEYAHLTLGKFNYLVGFGLLDHFPESLAFVELANRSKDMQDVKQAAAAIQEGYAPQEVFGRFGMDMAALAEPPVASVAESGTARFASPILSGRQKPRSQPRTHLDFALQKGTGISQTL